MEATTLVQLMRSISILQLILIYLLPAVDAEESVWVNPPAPGPNKEIFSDNRVWRLGSTQTIEWSAGLDYPNFIIALWQERMGPLDGAIG